LGKAKVEKQINLAVVGAGYWGRKVIEEYTHLEEVDPAFNLVEICDLKEENLDYCKDALKIDPNVLNSDYEAVLKSSNIDAVHICTPNETHYRIGMQALNESKHVLLEKPIAMMRRDAWSLCEIAEAMHLCLQVGHIYRFNNAIKRVRSLIARGYFGELYYLKLQWTTWMPSPLGRDIIFDLGPHPIDILNFLLGRWPIKVGCTGNYYRRPSLEEVAYFSMDFGSQLMAHVELSWLEPGKVRELSIMGSEKAAKIDCLRQSIEVFEDQGGDHYSLLVPENNTIFDEVHHFVTSIRDENNHKNPGSVGAANVSVLESLKKALQEEKVVKVGLES
jgi:UDP-N-acetylglucosamine 3-dehydrogenase